MAADTLGLDDDRIVLKWVLVKQSLRIEIWVSRCGSLLGYFYAVNTHNF
jgi:hypothetical protein